MIGKQNADITDTLQIKDDDRAGMFWLSIYGMHIGAAWRIRLNLLCASAMRFYVKLL